MDRVGCQFQVLATSRERAIETPLGGNLCGSHSLSGLYEVITRALNILYSTFTGHMHSPIVTGFNPWFKNV
jgi:hypothetical protein